MNRRLASWLCVLGAPSFLVAQQSRASHPPAHTRAETAETAQAARHAAADYSREPFIIERYSTKVRFENDGTGEQVLAVRARVQNEAGAQQLRELVFRYESANQQMDVHYVRVRKADGAVVNASADSEKDLGALPETAYAQLKDKHITMPALAPGDTVEYEIATRLITPLAPGEFWFAQRFLTKAIALDERLEISVPAGRKVTVRSPVAPFETVRSNDRTIYRWKRSNFAVKPDDPAKDSADGGKAKAPDVQLTSFADWAAVARWYSKLQQDRTQPSAEVRAKAEELTRDKSDGEAKAQALYDYVATRVRTIDISLGDAGWQPHTAGEVLANGYGDSADKSVLLTALLRAAGIASETALLPSGRALDESLPTPAQFDHAITAVQLGAGTIWLDSTTEVAPFRMLASPLRNKAALRVEATGEGKIVHTPADPPFLSSQRVDIDGRVDDLGKLAARARYVMRGDTELVLRTAFHHSSQEQWNQLAQTVLTLDGLRGEVTAVRASDPTATHDPFELDMDFKQGDFLDWMSQRESMPLPLLTMGLPDPPANSAKPIDLGSPLDVDVKLKLEIPPNFSAQAPVALSISRDYADFHSSYGFADHVVTAERSLNFKMRSLPAGRADDYKDFARAVAADENRPLVVANISRGEPAIPASATAADLVEAGRALLSSGNAASAAPLLARAAELDPRHKEAWGDLGLAELRLGKLDDAVTAFRKQIEIDPGDPRANGYLGLAFERQNKHAEAAAAFRRQTEINPLDASAHAVLGELLLDQHDYANAAPELDKATILSPDNAQLRVELGRALLNTGDQTKAIAAFEKAAVLSPTPAVWNDIAFDLAESKLDLDKAQQYAASAVRGTGASIGKVDLQRVTQGQLGKVASLAECWDTLGWVYFQKGDLEQAERYIRAAWNLDQNGEIGDHLAQIYGRRGEKDRAIKAYSLALAAPRSIPETRARLTLVLGSNAGIDDLVTKSGPELVASRTIPAGRLATEEARADVLIALSPGEKSARPDAVRFISGSEALRPAAEKLRLLDYGEVFPDKANVTIIRRATLSCPGKSGECTLELIPAEEARAP